ncbi:MAG: hypothetical protein IKC08_01225 [Lentisphaeria bacterium]|nr:hypothetical protein [Lentisphaeria bacterium]
MKKRVLFISALFSFSILVSSAFSAEQKKENKELFYPDITELWTKGPVGEKAISPEVFYTRLSPEILKKHGILYTNLKDPSLRIRHAGELKKSVNKDTFILLASLLEKENDPFCCSSLLSSLAFLAEKGFGDPSYAEKLFLAGKDKNTESRKNAFFLYFLLAENPDPEKVLAQMDGKNDGYLMKKLFPFFVQYAEKIPAERIRKYCADKNPELKGRGYALIMICSSRNAALAREGKMLLANMDKQPDIIKYYTAKGLAYQKDLSPEGMAFLRKESETGFLAVYLAEMEKFSCITEKQEIFLKDFLDQKYLPGIRLGAAKALKNGRSRISGEALARLLEEGDVSLRKAVCCSLIKVSPDEKVRKNIASTGKKYYPSRLEAAKIFTEIKDPAYHDLMILFLEEAGKKDKQATREIALQEILIKYMGKEKVRKGVSAVCGKSTSPIPSVRKECALALGELALPETFSTLKKLIRDRNESVAEGGISAVLSMVMRKALPLQELKKHFAGEIKYLLKTRRLEFAAARAVAVRTAADLDLTAVCRNDLITLTEKECIRVPQSPNCYDSDAVRISCLFAFYEAGKKSNGKPMLEIFASSLKKLLAEANKKDSYASDSWKEYLNQLDCLRQGKKILPGKVKTTPPEFSIAPLKKF